MPSEGERYQSSASSAMSGMGKGEGKPPKVAFLLRLIFESTYSRRAPASRVSLSLASQVALP